MPEESKIEVKAKNLNTVLSEMERGILRVPRFQRDYVWERTRIAKLFDSIYKEMPIGSFFLWIAPMEFRNIYKDIPELKLPKPDEYETIKMILDGQQRLISLYVVSKGLELGFDGGSRKDYKKICFDLDKGEFLVVHRREDKERIISLWRFFNDDGQDEIYDNLTKERRESFRKCQRRIANYPVSIVEVTDKNIEEAVLIFERINQGGKRLGLFDLVVAGTWSEDFDLKAKANDLIKEIKNSGFGKISEEIISQTLSLVAKDQCTQSVQLHLTNKDIRSYWDVVEDGILEAIDFLKGNLGVKIYDFIPYPSMIAMVAYLFAKRDRRALSPDQAVFVKEWFWKTAFSQRYRASTLTLMGDDIKKYFMPILVRKSAELKIPINLSLNDIRDIKIYNRSAIKNAIFCLLAIQQPLHFRNGSTINLDYQICSEYNSHEKHHIFPKAFLKQNSTKHKCHKYLLLNFAFIPAELNKEISKEKPSKYFNLYKKDNRIFGETMKSHLIPCKENSAIWDDDYDKFIEQRGELIYEKIKRLVGEISEIEVSLEEEPIGVIKDIEKKMRRFINKKMMLNFKGDYWEKIPSDIQERIEDRIKERVRRQPYERDNFRKVKDKINFCDIMDYFQIIQKYWNIFQDDFGSRAELQKHSLNIKDYRNGLMHVREMNRIERKQGEASVEWLLKILDKTKI